MRKPTVKRSVRGTRSRFLALSELKKMVFATVFFGQGNQVILSLPSKMTAKSIKASCRRKYDEVKKVIIERPDHEPLILT